MRAQSALEYLILLGISLAVLVPLWLYVSSQVGTTRQDLQVTYARLAVDKIADAADLVYVQGPPSQISVVVTLPDNIISTRVDSKEILLQLSTPGGASDVYAVTLGNVSGAIPTRPGPIRLLVKSEGTYVNITEGG